MISSTPGAEKIPVSLEPFVRMENKYIIALQRVSKGRLLAEDRKNVNSSSGSRHQYFNHDFIMHQKTKLIGYVWRMLETTHIFLKAGKWGERIWYLFCFPWYTVCIRSSIIIDETKLPFYRGIPTNKWRRNGKILTPNKWKNLDIENQHSHNKRENYICLLKEEYATILKQSYQNNEKPHDLVSPTNIKGAWKEEEPEVRKHKKWNVVFKGWEVIKIKQSKESSCFKAMSDSCNLMNYSMPGLTVHH